MSGYSNRGKVMKKTVRIPVFFTVFDKFPRLFLTFFSASRDLDLELPSLKSDLD